jgi:hypothetical protein
VYHDCAGYLRSGGGIPGGIIRPLNSMGTDEVYSPPVYIRDIIKKLGYVEHFMLYHHVRGCLPPHTEGQPAVSPHGLRNAAIRGVYNLEQAIVDRYEGVGSDHCVPRVDTAYCCELLQLFQDNEWYNYTVLMRVMQTHLRVDTGLKNMLEWNMQRPDWSCSMYITNMQVNDRLEGHVDNLLHYIGVLNDLCLLLCRVSDGGRLLRGCVI